MKKIFREIWRSLFGLFVDDEFLAVATLAVVAATAALIFGLGVQTLFAGGVLLVGNVAVLVIGTARTASKRRKP